MCFATKTKRSEYEKTAAATIAVAEPEPHFISLFVGWIAFFVLIAVLLLLLVATLASAEIENKNLYVCACITWRRSTLIKLMGEKCKAIL